MRKKIFSLLIFTLTIASSTYAQRSTITGTAVIYGSGYNTRTQWTADAERCHDFPHSLRLDLPPLSAVLLSLTP